LSRIGGRGLLKAPWVTNAPNDEVDCLRNGLQTRGEVNQRVAGKHLVGRADAGLGQGYGHVARVSTLLLRWVTLGGGATLCGHGIDGAFRRRLDAGGVTVVELSAQAIAEPNIDVGRTLAVACAVDAAAIIIDGYEFTADHHGRLQAAYPLLAIDDLAAFSPMADVVLNQNLDAARAQYPPGGHARFLLGARYALLRASFGAAPRQTECRRGVIVTFGASDPAGLTPIALGAVLQAVQPGLPIDVLLGPGVDPALSIAVETLAEAAGQRVRVHRDVMDVAALFRKASVAITAAGASCWELLACGVPPIMVSVADNQRPIAAAIQAHGAGVDLGPQSRLDVTHLGTCVAQLLDTPTRLAALRQSASDLVDGRGVDRVLCSLLDVIDGR